MLKSSGRQFFPPYIASLLLVAICVGVYLWQVASGVDWRQPGIADTISWGGNVAPLTLTGDSWRLATSMFLHAGLIHLLVNMYMLVGFGLLAERLFGTLNFLVIYLLSGLVGGLVSAYWHGMHVVADGHDLVFGTMIPDERLSLVVSVGASGALMGLAGASLVSRIWDPVDPGEGEQASAYKPIAQVIGINLLIGFLIPGIDNASHLGGVVAGLALGAILSVHTGSRIMSLARLVAVALLGYGIVVSLADSGATEQLTEIREQLLAERTQAAVRAKAGKQRQAAEEAVAADAKNAPPVNESVAAGTQVRVGQSPAAFVLSADGKRLYVANNEDNSISVIDTGRREVAKTIDGGSFPFDQGGCRDNFCRGRGAAGIAVRADQRFAYVTSMKEDALAVVDLATDVVVAAVPVGRFPRNLVLSADERTAYVMNAVDNSISVVDLLNHKTIGEPLLLKDGDAGHLPFGRPLTLWLAPDGKHLYVKNDVNHTIEVFDAATRQFVRALSAGGEFSQVVLSRDGRSLWALGRNALKILDPRTLEPIRELPYCRHPRAPKIAVNADGTLLAMADRDFRQLRLIGITTRNTLGVYPAGPNPLSMLFSADSKTLYVLNSGAAGVSFLDISKSMDPADNLTGNDDYFCRPN